MSETKDKLVGPVQIIKSAGSWPLQNAWKTSFRNLLQPPKTKPREVLSRSQWKRRRPWLCGDRCWCSVHAAHCLQHNHWAHWVNVSGNEYDDTEGKVIVVTLSNITTPCGSQDTKNLDNLLLDIDPVTELRLYSLLWQTNNRLQFIGTEICNILSLFVIFIW